MHFVPMQNMHIQRVKKPTGDFFFVVARHAKELCFRETTIIFTDFIAFATADVSAVLPRYNDRKL